MGLTEENEKKLQKQHQELCKSLNLEKSATNETWKVFKKIYDTYVLEGDPLHWLGCALYVACKTSTTPTVSKNYVMVQGNLVSLARLLRIFDLSLIDFFLKIRKWVSLLDLPTDIRESIDKLERIFNVSMVLFKKFQPIFNDMFNVDSQEYAKTYKWKKLMKSVPPPATKVFDFTWTLFLCIKSNFPNIVDDLVNSYHLLLACCDFIYANAFMSGRKDLLIDNYTGLPNTNKTKFHTSSDVPCIIDKLCEVHDGKRVEAKSIREYYWRKQIKTLFDKKQLKGNSDLLSDILDASNFEFNSKSINKIYEEFVLSAGSVDERVFIGYQPHPTGGITHNTSGNSVDSDSKKSKNDNNSVDRNTLQSPLRNNKSYEQESETIATIISSKSGPSLKSLLQARPTGPSEYLKHLKVTTKMEETVSEAMTKLFEGLRKVTSEKERPSIKETENVTHLVKKMFYKLLDSIFSEEIKKPEFVPDQLLNQEIFIKTLFACAFEIISFTMNLNKNFPWILETLDISPFHYYRIIEVVVRNEDALKRDVVKHLNVIEETILESLAWNKDSPLWKAIIESPLTIPSSEDVIVPNQEERDQQQDGREERFDAFVGKTMVLTNSPGAPLADKFLSPIKHKRPINEVGGVTNNEGEPPNKVTVVKSGANIENINISNTLNKVSVGGKDSTQNDEKTKKGQLKKSKRTGSIPLFFRKFYYLASVRLKDMCNQLRIIKQELRLKIWNCFETTIVQNIGLMLDRHLDQMLMCSIYVICKIVGHDLSFMDMMKCYRNQPQAQSQVYRNVLITPNFTLDDLKNNKVTKDEEERGDIIRFYNYVYVHKVKEFAKKFRPTGDNNERFVLSPIPVKKSTPINGPKRITESLPIYLSGPGMRYMSPNSKPLNYVFARSPAKDLHAINVMVSHEMIPKIGKQLLDETSNTTSSSNLMTRKVKDLFAERMTMKTQEPTESSNHVV